MTGPIVWGLLFGFAVGAANNLLALYVITRRLKPVDKAPRQVVWIFLVRLVTSFMALYLVRRDVLMLVSTLFGILLARNLWLVRELLRERGG